MQMVHSALPSVPRILSSTFLRSRPSMATCDAGGGRVRLRGFASISAVMMRSISSWEKTASPWRGVGRVEQLRQDLVERGRESGGEGAGVVADGPVGVACGRRRDHAHDAAKDSGRMVMVSTTPQ